MNQTGKKQLKEIPQNNISLESFLKNLHDCLQSLVQVIEKENKLLSHTQKNDFNKTLDQKEELLVKLQKLEGQLSGFQTTESTDNIKKLVDKISKIYSQLQKVSETNNILLKSNIIVSGKIIELYKTKHLDHTISQLGYNKDGEMAALKKLEKVMPAISLNNKI